MTADMDAEDLPTVTLPALCTVPDVELCRVGDQWRPAAGGDPDGVLRIGPADLTAMVAASTDRSLPRPVVKLGHTDPRTNGADPYDYDATPALGRVCNLRLAREGTALVGDLAGVPGWLAYALPTAWPHRSIEAMPGPLMAALHPGAARHTQVMTGLALLGVSAPAIAVLDDVPAFLGLTPVPTPVQLGAAMPATVPPPPPIRAGLSVDDVRHAIYDAETSFGWVVDWRIATDGTLSAIYEDGDGRLWRIPVTVDGDGVTLGDPAEIRLEDVDVPSAPGTPSPIDTADDDEDQDVAVAARVAPTPDRPMVAARIAAAAARQVAAARTPAGAEGPAAVTTRLLEDNVGLRMQHAAERKQAVIGAALAAGKMTAPERRQVWEPLYDVAPEIVEAHLAALPRSCRVPVDEIGFVGDGDTADLDAEYRRLMAGRPNPLTR